MIIIDNKEYKVEITRKKIRNIYLRVHDDTLSITCPKHISDEQIYSFINSKTDWVRKTINKNEENSLCHIGETVYYLGKPYKLNIAYGNNAISIKDGEINIKCRSCDIEGATNVLYEHSKKVIMLMVYELQDKYLKILKDYGYTDEPVYKVKYLKSMWGCCYNRRNLVNLSVRLIHFDPICLEAVLWHELLHFIIPNHSKRFHEVLDYHMPRYKEIIKTLH